MFLNKKIGFVIGYFVLIFLIIATSVFSEELQVSIKGMANGSRNRQRDYKAAVLDAKIKAIEQAGAEIESLTQIRNYQVKEKTVEAKSKGVILSGYQIIDIGYVADGTYQVVLIGKIQVGEKTTQARVIGRDGSFIVYENGTIQDMSTNLMWAVSDNGRNINWANAKSYCENYRGGGYTDWRMPTQDELSGLYDPAKTRKCACGLNVHLTELIRLTCIVAWASETRDFAAALFDFESGARIWTLQSNDYSYRALPVRSVK